MPHPLNTAIRSTHAVHRTRGEDFPTPDSLYRPANASVGPARLRVHRCAVSPATAATRGAGTVPENDRFTQPATTTTDANLGDIMTALPTPPDLPVPAVAGPGQRLADAVTLVHSLLAQGHLDPAELGLGHLGVLASSSGNQPGDRSIVPVTPIRLVELQKKTEDGLSVNTLRTYRTYLNFLVKGATDIGTAGMGTGCRRDPKILPSPGWHCDPRS